MTRNKWIARLLSVPLILGVALPVATATRKQSEGSPAIPASGAQGANTSVQRLFVLEEDVQLRSWIALGAPLLDEQGRMVRPVAFSGSFLCQRVHLGEVHELRSVLSSGHEGFHFDLSGVDLGVANPALSEQAARRHYQVDVSPRSGLNWDAVVDPRQDVEVKIARIS